MFFKKKVDTRSRQSMIDFLTGHFRYNTMNSWNGLTSYANKVKFHHLGLTKNQQDKAWDMLDVNFWDEINYPINDFTKEMNGYYTISSNGRSSGYLVLMNSHYESTGYKSFCKSCGQRNYKTTADLGNLPPEEAIIVREVVKNAGIWTPETYLDQSAIQAISTRLADDFTVEFSMDEKRKLAIIRKAQEIAKDCTIDNKCGRCHAEGDDGRANYATPPRQLSVASKGIDQGETFDSKDEWSMSMLRDRVELVRRFDRACDEIRDNFIALLDNCSIVEETIMVPQTHKVLQCAHTGGI